MIKRIKKLFLIIALALLSVSFMAYFLLNDFVAMGPTTMASMEMEGIDIDTEPEEDPSYISLSMGVLAVIFLLAVLILKRLG
ncbi:MAG: hypothetical protein ACE5J7_01365 [Candidatus Aenigmatarchaeota archaeon]